MYSPNPLSNKQLAPIVKQLARFDGGRLAAFKQVQAGLPFPHEGRRYLSIPQVARMIQFSVGQVRDMIFQGHRGVDGHWIRLCAVEVFPGCWLVPQQGINPFGLGLSFELGKPVPEHNQARFDAWSAENAARRRRRFRRLRHFGLLRRHPAWRRRHPGSCRRRSRPMLKVSELFRVRCFMRLRQAGQQPAMMRVTTGGAAAH